MRGNISVTDSSQPGTSGDNAQTVGLLMVPTEDLAQYTQDLQSRGFVIDSTTIFLISEMEMDKHWLYGNT